MTDYTKYLEDTVWCSDTSLYKEDSDVWYWGAMERNVNLYKPSIECPNANDKFTVGAERGNGILTYPVALLTADEATLAGSGFKGYSSDSYLYTNQDWWLITPSFVSISISGIGYPKNFSVNSDGALDSYSGIQMNLGLRPSISFSSGAVVSSGDGTMNSPFTILL